MRSADKQTGIRFPQDIAHANFMLGRAVRMKKQHSHRFKTLFLYDLCDLARLLLVKRRAHRAVGEHPLRHFEDILAWHQGSVFTEARVEGFRAIYPADLVNVAKSFGSNERRLTALTLDDRVDHDGRAVDQR